MSGTYRKGYVYIQDRYAGIIEETEDGYRFCYDDEYIKSENAVAVSITMSLSNKEYNNPVLFPFFDGLIPEGWLLNVASRNWKLNTADRFGLLLVACKDCIGDVSIRIQKEA